MKKIILLLFLKPFLTFSQPEPDYKKFIPKNIIVKPITDTLNFIGDSVRLSIMNYLDEKNIDLKNCFIDKFVRENQNEIIVIVRDLRDLKSEKEYEKTHHYDDTVDYESIGGTFTYNKKTRKLEFSPDE